MPIYEYQCKSCGKEVEILQSSSETQKQKCPSCDGQMERLMSAHGVGRASAPPPPSCGSGGCSGGTCPYN